MDSGKPMELFMETERVSERKAQGAAREECARMFQSSRAEVFLSTTRRGMNSSRLGVPEQPR